MKNNKLIYFFSLVFILQGCYSKKIIREDIEWSNFRWNHESDLSKPRMLFIGNSISVGYVPEVISKIKSAVNCDHFATSRSIEDPALVKETKIAMGKYEHSVIHFNNGLHGWHLTNEQYKKGLEKYVKFLLSNKAKDCYLVYSLTTPVSNKGENHKLDPVKNQIVQERNHIAREVMHKYSIPVIDLYALMEPDLDSYVIEKGNLHYNKEGYQILASKISKEILKLLVK